MERKLNNAISSLRFWAHEGDEKTEEEFEKLLLEIAEEEELDEQQLIELKKWASGDYYH